MMQRNANSFSAWQLFLALHRRMTMVARLGTRRYTNGLKPLRSRRAMCSKRRLRVEEECRVQESGLRNGAYGADKFGFKELAAVRWNLTEPALYEHAIAAGEATIVAGGALCAETGHHTGRSPEGQAHGCRRSHREFRVVGQQSQDVAREFRQSARRFHGACQRQERCSRRISMAAPIRNTASRFASLPNSPGTRCSSASC